MTRRDHEGAAVVGTASHTGKTPPAQTRYRYLLRRFVQTELVVPGWVWPAAALLSNDDSSDDNRDDDYSLNYFDLKKSAR